MTLSEESRQILLALARPLPPMVREVFFRQVVDALAGYDEIGPGTVYRAAMAVQQALFDAPALDGSED